METKHNDIIHEALMRQSQGRLSVDFITTTMQRVQREAERHRRRNEIWDIVCIIGASILLISTGIFLMYIYGYIPTAEEIQAYTEMVKSWLFFNFDDLPKYYIFAGLVILLLLYDRQIRHLYEKRDTRVNDAE